MELILIRHGESEGNVKGVVYGQTDYPLTDKGLTQVPVILDALEQYKITKVYTSPLSRAKVIGEAIGERYSKEVIKEDRLKEINFGDYEDKTRTEVMEIVGDKYYDVIGFFCHYAIPSGEHQDVFLERVRNFVEELLKEEDGVYVITAHYGVIKGILNYLMGFEQKMFRQLAIKPGAIMKLSIKKDRVRLDELVQTFDRV